MTDLHTAATFELVATLADLAPGQLLGVVKSDGERVCLVNLDGEILAVSDVCTHQDFPMSEGCIVKGQIECAWHGARFDCHTGRATHPPADDPLPRYAVRVEDDGRIFVGGRLP
ncbi:MAG TPA: non-heme iron oxygenase ferredoxin subunit [Gemmatimonadaceae bacterium]|nr:non-heme iron oxygenase ferredoxin subunit [Gemmatimonadaceae bacterium]